MPEKIEVESVYKAACGCRWASKQDRIDNPDTARVTCDVHRPRPEVTVYADAAPNSYDPPPTHYSTGAGIDPWAVWDAFDLDRYTANAVKYLLRAGKKDIAPRLDDLIKARNYINKAIEREQAK